MPTAPRRRDAEATRAAILAAAKNQFATHGYDGAALRDIAAAAGVDVALIKRYFGAKDGLYRAALEASFSPERLHGWDRTHFPRQLATMMADSSYGDLDSTQRFQFLLRAATSPTTAPMLSEAIQARFLEPIRAWLGGSDALARARVFAAVYIGVLVERLVRDAPLRGRERGVYIARVTGLLEAIATDTRPTESRKKQV